MMKDEKFLLRRTGRQWLDPDNEAQTGYCAWDVEVEEHGEDVAYVNTQIEVGFGSGELLSIDLFFCDDQAEMARYRCRVAMLRHSLALYMDALDEAWKRHQEHAGASPPGREGDT